MRILAIMESRVPQSGAYWWIPLPDGNWTIEVFYDSEYNGDTPHDDLWRRYVVERLAILWNKSPEVLRRRIGDNYTGLPRGRVSKVSGGWTIVHGNDAPALSKGIRGVINAFNLRMVDRSNLMIMDDDHERMMPGDPEAVQKALGADLGLRADFTMDW